MKGKHAISLVLMLACFECPFLLAAEPEPPGKPILLEGKWTHRGSRSILGKGTDTTVTFTKNAGD